VAPDEHPRPVQLGRRIRTPKDIHEQTTQVSAEELKFESALGCFTLSWSDTEAMTYRVLVRYAGVTEWSLAPSFSGTRAR